MGATAHIQGAHRHRDQPDSSAAGAAYDKHYYGHDFENTLADADLHLLRPARRREPERADQRFFKPLRQTIESIFDTAKGQLDLEHHGAHTPAGVVIRVLQRLLALTAAIWHNDHTGQPIKRSLLAYGH
jgi:hypothetical protein